MKLSNLILILASLLLVACASAQPTAFPPASQAEVDAGVISSKFVSPKTLNAWTGAGGGGTNGFWGAIAGSISNQTDLQAQFGTTMPTNGGVNFGGIFISPTLKSGGNTFLDSSGVYSGGQPAIDFANRALDDSLGNTLATWSAAGGPFTILGLLKVNGVTNSSYSYVGSYLKVVGATTNSTQITTGILNAGGLSSLRTNAWTTADLATNAFGLWNSNGLGTIYLSYNKAGTVTNLLWGGSVDLTAYQKTNSALDKVVLLNLSGFTNLSASGMTFTGSKRILGRNTGTLGGTGEELDLSTVLDWTTNATGSILYRSGTGWTYLLPGSEGTLLLAHGAAAPTWGNSISNLNIGTQTVTNSYGLTNIWSGPTNSLALNGGEYDYTMTANTAVTNFSSILSSAICRGTLWLKNTSGGNLTFNVPASVVTADGLRTWTVTNNQFGVVTFDMKPSVRTNAAFVNQF